MHPSSAQKLKLVQPETSMCNRDDAIADDNWVSSVADEVSFDRDHDHSVETRSSDASGALLAVFFRLEPEPLESTEASGTKSEL